MERALLTLFLLLPVVLGANPYWKFQKDGLARVKCDDGTSCPGDDTCCPTGSDTYGCCPDPNAVCCSDGKHCCPNGYQCDLADNTCTKGGIKEKVTLQELVRKVPAVVCPDSRECPDGDTCCLVSSDEYGCCPQPNAVCCSDHTHCCPEGYQCDVDSGTCTKGTTAEIFSLIKHVKNVKDIKCPGNYSCADGDTCCPYKECCPHPDATCCSDGIHCCPSGYTCNYAAGTCVKGTTAEVFTLLKHVKNVKDITCPGGSESCPDGDTCCPNSQGYGCCPLPDANCCSDGVHCCPSGYTCDLAAGTCLKSSLDCDKATGNCPDGAIVKTIDSPELMKAREHTDVESDVKNVICPGGEYYCPDGNTCCPNNSGGYGCCPLPNAVCCSDGVHCCPSGQTCGDGYCQKSSLSGLEDRIPFLKVPASRRL